MLTARQLFAWLVELDDPGAPQERQEALRDGYSLARLAAGDGLISGDEQGYGRVAMLLGELRHDGWLRWEWQAWPTDEEPTSGRMYRAHHLQRMENLRITPEAYGAHITRARLRSQTEAWPESNEHSDRPTADRPHPLADGDRLRDVFISHASEDKETIARPLTDALQARGYSVWFAEYELTIGDSLTQSIDRGLSTSRFGVVVLSPAFLTKPWPQRELRGLVAKEMAGGEKVILPVWHGVDHAAVAAASPPLADLLAANSGDGVEAVADRIVRAIDRRRGLEQATGHPTPARELARPELEDEPVAHLADLRDELVGLLRAGDGVGLRELLLRERRHFDSKLIGMLQAAGDELNSSSELEHLRPLEENLWELIERRLASLLPLVEYDSERLGEELHALGALAERSVPTRSPLAAWQQGHRWAIWLLLWTIGPAAVTGGHLQAARVLWRTTTAEEGETVPLAAIRQLGGFELGDRLTLAHFGKRMSLDGLWHLAFRLSGSELVVEHYPELLQGPTPSHALGFLSRAGDWAWTMAALSGRDGGQTAVPRYWHASQVQATLPGRLERDATLRALYAEDLFGVSSTAPAWLLARWVERAPGPREFP